MCLVILPRPSVALFATHKALKRNHPVCWNKPRLVKYSKNAESFLSGSNANFLEAQYLDWSKTRGAIDSSWDNFYNSVSGPQLKIEEFENEFSPTTVKKKGKDKECGVDIEAERRKKIKLHLAVQQLIRSYQARGHLLAKVDPLSLMIPAHMISKYKTTQMDTVGLKSPFVARELGHLLSNIIS